MGMDIPVPKTNAIIKAEEMSKPGGGTGSKN